MMDGRKQMDVSFVLMRLYSPQGDGKSESFKNNVSYECVKVTLGHGTENKGSRW